MSLIIYDIHSYIVCYGTSGLILILIVKRHEPRYTSRNNMLVNHLIKPCDEYLHFSPSVFGTSYVSIFLWLILRYEDRGLSWLGRPDGVALLGLLSFAHLFSFSLINLITACETLGQMEEGDCRPQENVIWIRMVLRCF